MSRGLWFVAGAGAGIYAMVRGRRAAEALTVDGLRDRVGAAVVGARMLREEVALGHAEAQAEMRERLAVAAPTHRQLATATARDDIRTTPHAAPHAHHTEEGRT